MVNTVNDNGLERMYELIRGHIRSFLTRGRHYSREDNSGCTYLSTELSITRLHRVILEKYDPEYLQLEEENCQRKIAHQQLPGVLVWPEL